MLNVACFVQSCLTDADFVIFSNYCLIGTRLRLCFYYARQKIDGIYRFWYNILTHESVYIVHTT